MPLLEEFPRVLAIRKIAGTDSPYMATPFGSGISPTIPAFPTSGLHRMAAARGRARRCDCLNLSDHVGGLWGGVRETATQNARRTAPITARCRGNSDQAERGPLSHGRDAQPVSHSCVARQDLRCFRALMPLEQPVVGRLRREPGRAAAGGREKSSSRSLKFARRTTWGTGWLTNPSRDHQFEPC